MVLKSHNILKNTFDFLLALLSLLILLIPILILIVIASISTKSCGLFFQERIGLHGKVFNILKIKSMLNSKNNINITSITLKNNERITKFGSFLRMFKLDELPQLVNVLCGDMSFVGPRPDVKGYADELEGNDRIILTVKPGITGPATLFFKNEETLLKNTDDPKKYNDTIIWPKKVELNKIYIKNWSFLKDIKYIIKTIF